jgi:hypothetical protein
MQDVFDQRPPLAADRHFDSPLPAINELRLLRDGFV